MGPWTSHIIWLLQTEGPLRFGELKVRMGRISSKVLTERLRLLEASHLLTRTYVATIPPAVTYALTPRGQELKSVMHAINIVATRWQAEDAAAMAQAS